MNDEQVIRRAVELADGWNLDGDVFGYEPDNPHNLDGINNIRQFELDALAAQLVRQVDALGDQGVWIKIGEQSTQVKDDHNRTELANCHSEGRTMNTLRAIVESKVLEADNE